jgi:teichoic acid transport system permease protein
VPADTKLEDLSATPPITSRAAREDEFNSIRHVYEPHKVGLPPLGSYLREAWRRREFAFELSRTEIRSKHVDTFFGQLWLILNPLLLAGVYFLLVDILRKHTRGTAFLAHLVAGIFAYYFVSGSVREGAKSVIGGGRLVLNTAFPRVLLPIASVITAVKRFIPTLVIYIPLHLAAGLPIGLHMLWVVPIVLLLTGVATGLAMLVAAGQVYFRDLSSFLPYILRIWLYISPVLWYAKEVPHGLHFLIYINPIGALLAAWSQVLNLGGQPGVGIMLTGLAWSVVLLIAGFLFYVSRERDFAVRL